MSTDSDLIPSAIEPYLNADERGGVLSGKDSLTVAEAGDQLIRGEPGWSAMGQPYTVSYGFRETAPATMPDGVSGFTLFNPAQIAQAELALQAWADVARISFTRVAPGAYTDQAAILFGNYANGEAGAAAFAYFPGSADPGSRAGDVWINPGVNTNGSPVTFNYGGHVLVHEIGHTIGLDHPGDYDSVKGSNPTYNADAGYAEDSRQYTVMSYFSEFNTGGNFGGLYAASPLLDDIAAAQQMYGANMATRTGDTVYGFNSNAGRPWFEAAASQRVVFAAWDAGGTDTFDFGGYVSDAVIDLRQGHFSSVGGLTGNVAIAMGTDIERAQSGSGNDVIYGNDLANWLRGGAGADRMWGIGGFDDMQGNTGADSLWGGDGGDWVVGGQDADLLNGEAGDDIIYGNLGADTALGGDGADTIVGGQQDDVIRGEAGNDWLGGDRGADTLTGGSGADTFRFFAGAGIERITDFNPAEGDRILLEGGGGYTLVQSGPDLVINLAPGDQIILSGVSQANLTAGWILSG
ncbi:MAG: M57 family metalloprotease [Phenylobacterium sp.]